MAAKQSEIIEIPQLDIHELDVVVVGDSPLVVHSWDPKAKRQMLDSMQKKAPTGKEAKDPVGEYGMSLYWLSKLPARMTMSAVQKGKFGFPTAAFWQAGVCACRSIHGVEMTKMRTAFRIFAGEADAVNGKDCVRIKGKPSMREDPVRVGRGTDLRYRAEFMPWSVTLPIRFNPSVISAEQVVNLINVAGFAIGIGEGRPEKNGSWGTFHVERA